MRDVIKIKDALEELFISIINKRDPFTEEAIGPKELVFSFRVIGPLNGSLRLVKMPLGLL